MSEFALLVLVSAGFVGLGRSVLGWFTDDDAFTWLERLIFSFAIGWFILYLGVFAVGEFQLNLLSMALLGIVLGVLSLPGLRRLYLDSDRPSLAGWYREQSYPARAVFMVTGAVCLSALVQGLAPPNDYDSLMYHLAAPQFDIETGRNAIPWSKALPHVFFPALGGNITRFALAVSTPGLAQMLHGMLGIIAAIAAAIIVRRNGYSEAAALAAALLFVSIRVVVWQMATVEVDVILASFAILALLAYLNWRERPTMGTALLFGLMVGLGILSKYHGFMVALAFGPLILFDCLRRGLPWRQGMLAGPLVAFVVLLPHAIRNFAYTGNPIFPIFNPLFNPGQPNHLETLRHAFVDGYGFDQLILTVWRMFTEPMQHFDGMIYGAPIVLALAPLVLLGGGQARKWGPAVTWAAGYYLLWFYFMGHQIRFLLPIMPLLAALAVAGGSQFWQAAKDHALARWSFIALISVMTINQSMFVGILGALRLPAATGLISAPAYHSAVPTMDGAYYATCTFIKDNLEPGEAYFSATTPHSFYCPQASVVDRYFDDEAKWWLSDTRWPEMSLAEFSTRLEAARIRYFILPIRKQNRRNSTAEQIMRAVDFESQRFGRVFRQAVEQLNPVFEGRYTAVYDGRQVTELVASLAQREERN